MTPSEQHALPYFRLKTRRADGSLIKWETAYLHTFLILEDVRALLGKNIDIIRETHPDKSTAVDFNIPGCPMEAAFMALDPRPAALGFYAGTHGPTYHIDLRPIVGDNRAARWIAVRPEDEIRIQEFTALIYSRTPEWLYLQWGNPASFRALTRVMQIAEANRQTTEGPKHAA